MHEYGGTPALDGVGPIPIRQKDQIIKRIGTAEGFVAVGIGGSDHHIVIFVAWIIGPKIPRSDGNRPIGWAGDAIRPIQHPNQAVNPARGRAVAFAFAM